MRLQPNIKLLFSNIIWRIAPDNASDYVLIESRDEQRKKVKFHGVDLTSGKITSEFRPNTDDWWVGIESINDKKVILHGYESDESPIHKGLFCHSLVDGSELWNFNDYQTENITLQSITIKSSSEVVSKIDWNGKVIEKEETSEDPPSKFNNPNPYFQDSDHFKTVSEFIQQHFNSNPIELIEYLEWKNHIFISYYIAQNSKLANLLKVLNSDGEVVFEETLGQELKGIGINTFFLSQNQLIFTKNKTELFSYLID